MILHLRYRSVCRYAHSGRSFFLLPLSADLLPARSVPVFYGIQYNCCRLSLFTSSENQVSQQTPPHYITSLFNIQPTILPEYVLFFIVFSQNTCFFPLLLCALTKAPTENGSQKRFTIFPPDAMLFENDPENQSANRKDMYYVNRKNNYFGSNRRNRRIQGGEPCQPFKETARGCTRDYD